mgnify:CR=1 FL=1
MPGQKREVIDLRSQDFTLEDMKRLRKTALSNPLMESRPPNEMILFSDGNEQFQFQSLEDMEKKESVVPKEAEFLYYTLTWPSKGRCSIYLDPDRPTKVVLEGGEKWIDSMKDTISGEFQLGDRRYLLHTQGGPFVIWAVVVGISILSLIIASFVRGVVDPVMIGVVLLTSGILGIYLSIVNKHDLGPANTISFERKKIWWHDMVLHAITITLGIVCAILSTVLIENLMD